MSQELGTSTPTKFSKREWVHLIITLSIAQAFVWFISLQYANNTSALGYVSFAGTLISIILAVLAIGYTYGESQQQKNSSSTLASQLESLVKIKDKLEIQADALKSIETLKGDITDFKVEVIKHFYDTQSKIDFNNLSIQDLIKVNGLSSESENISSADSENLLRILLSDGESNLFALAVICYVLFKETGNVDLWNYFEENDYLKLITKEDARLTFTVYSSTLIVFSIMEKLKVFENGGINPLLKEKFNIYAEHSFDSALVKTNKNLIEYLKSVKKSKFYLEREPKVE